MSTSDENEADLGGLSFVTRRPVAIFMFMVAIAVFGTVSLGKLPMDLLPEISYPTLTVRTTYAGAAPEDVEDRVSIRIQEALSTLPGLVRTTSISRAGFSDVLLDFDWGTEMAFAVQDVRDKLDSLFLPAGIERPLILRYDPNLDPILRIALTPTRPTGEVGDLIQLRWLAEKRIKRELESIQGIAAVQVRGGLEEEIKISVDPYKMAAQKLDPTQLAARLSQENLNASGGAIREGSTEYLVRTLNEFQSVDEIANLSIVRRGGAPIRVRDIARVERTYADREVVTRIGGQEAVEIAIYREAGAKIVDVANIVKKRVFGTEEQQAWAEKQLSAGDGVKHDMEARSKGNFLAWRFRNEVQLETLSDQSTFIEAAINDVKEAAILGAIFAIFVMWLFLRRLSATIIVGLSIPISVVVAFAPMYMLGVSINIMSLGGLALGVGMLVDNAIVVLESIIRCREEGDDLSRASVRGVREVSGAILASTLTTVAVFAPIVFVHGIAGQIFGDQAVTVVSALLVSLLVAVLFIPMLASRPWLGGDAFSQLTKAHKFVVFEGLEWSLWETIPNVLRIGGRLVLWLLGWVMRIVVAISWVIMKVVGVLLFPIRWSFDALWNASEKTYPVILRAALAHPWLVLIAAAALFGAAMRRVPSLGVQLLPEIHQGEFTAHVGLGVGTPLEQTDRVLRRIDEKVTALDAIEVTALTVGVEKDTLTRDIEGEHTARLTVRLKPGQNSADDEERTLEAVREIFQDNAEIRTLDFSRPTPFALDAPIAVEIRGHNLQTLEELSGRVVDELSEMSELTDVRTTVRPGHPEVRVVFDRDKTLEYGLDLAAVSGLVRDQLLGNVSTRFVEGDERIDVRVRGDENLIRSLDNVMDLVVNPATDKPVPLNAVASFDILRGPAEIRRIGNTRAVVVTATGSNLDLGGAAAAVEARLNKVPRPGEVFLELGGQKREMEAGIESMKFALLLAIFLVYVVMASQFESLLQPLIIMLTVPLAGIGVVAILDVLNVQLSVVVFIGLILLAGIVVNNAIVLVDRINSKRAEGMEVKEAVLEAGRARLRPILMTSATTALGLIPLTGWLASLPILGLLGSGEGAEIRSPMAITVIGGLVTSTMLTLIVVPVVYSLLSRPVRIEEPEQA